MFQQLFGSQRRSPGATARAKVPTISAKALAERLGTDKSPLVVDVRTPYEYEHDGHIAGSRLLPLASLGQRLTELPRDREIVCACRSGSRPEVACELLQARGFDNVTNLSGGMIGWRLAGLPVHG